MFYRWINSTLYLVKWRSNVFRGWFWNRASCRVFANRRASSSITLETWSLCLSATISRNSLVLSCMHDCRIHRSECHCSGKTSCTRHSHSPNSFLSSTLILLTLDFSVSFSSHLVNSLSLSLPSLPTSLGCHLIRIFSTNAIELFQFLCTITILSAD